MARGGGRITPAAAGATPVTIDPAAASFGSWKGNREVGATLALAIRNASGGGQR